MGATAIIVCLTSKVSEIVKICRQILHMRCNVVDAIGTRNATSVAVCVHVQSSFTLKIVHLIFSIFHSKIKLYNGCNILVVTAPCLLELIKKTPHAIKNDKLKCIAFENIDCIMAKHPDICDTIIKELCAQKKKEEDRQIIVTSRTWIKELKQFLNEKIADSVLLIGNHIEAAQYAAAFEFVLCFNNKKLEQMKGDFFSFKISIRLNGSFVQQNYFLFKNTFKV